MFWKHALQEENVRDAEAKAWSVKERKRLVFVSSLALIVVAIFTALSLIIPGPVSFKQQDDWCKTADCLQHERLLTHSLNRSVDPCHDFEAYVCSTWNPDPRFPFLSTSPLDDLSIAWMEGLDNLLSKGVAVVSTARKPLSLFQTCTRGGPASEEDKWKFLDYIEELGLSWPQKPPRGATASASSVLVGIALRGEMPLWIRIRVTQNPLEPGSRRFVFLPGRPSYIRVFAANHQRLMEAGDYSRYWKLIYAFLLGRHPGADVGDIVKRSAEVQGTVVATLTQIAMSAQHSAAVLYNLSNTEKHSSETLFSRWITALRERLSDQVPLYNGDDVLFANRHFIPAIDQFLSTMSDSDALVHVSWQFVQMYVLMLDKALLEDIMGDKQIASSYLTMLCAREVEAVYRPFIVALFARITLSSAKKRQVNYVLNTLLRKAKDKVKEAAWLDPDAKRFLANKLESVHIRLWPSDLFDDALKVEKVYADCPESGVTFSLLWISARRCHRDLLLGSLREYTDGLPPNLTPLVAYDSVFDSVEVAVAALLSPFYYTSGTLGSVYGGFGFVFALSIMGVFAERQQYFLPNRSMDKSGFWISNKSAEALKRKLRCSELDHEAKKTRGAMIGAVEIAQSVFLERLARSTQRNLTSELTDEKVFFMTLCRTTCAKKTAKAISYFPAHCNYVVRNFKGFWDAFSCSKPQTANCRFFTQEK